MAKKKADKQHVKLWTWGRRVRKDIVALEKAVKKLDSTFQPGVPPGDPGDPPAGPYA